MIDAAAVLRADVRLPRSAIHASALVAALVAAGYLGASHPRIGIGVIGTLSLVGCGLIAYRHPPAATTASFALVLAAATKFRLRDATDSLAGIVDWQIVVELGLYAVIGTVVAAASAARGFRGLRAGIGEAAVYAYVTVALVSIIWSDAPALTAVRAIQLTVLAGLAAVSVRVMPRSRALWTAVLVLTGCVLICAASNAVFPAETTFDPEETHSRFAWFAVHPIAAGTLAAVATLVLLSPSLFSRAGAHYVFRLPRWLLLVPLICILVLTRARGPFLACVCAATVLIVMRVSAAVRLLLVTLAGGAVFFYLLSGADLRDWVGAIARTDWDVVQILVRGQPADRLLTLNGRLDLWRDLGSVIAAHPLLGHGFQASRAFVLETAPWAAYAHNALLQSLLDLGALGTVILVALISCGFAGAFRSSVNPWLRAVVLSLMVFLTINALTTESFAGSPGFETLLLFLCVLCTAKPRE